MEYIQAFLFTSKYILGRNGNTDIFYLFSVLIFLFYAWKRHAKLQLIIKMIFPVAVVCIGMTLFYPDINLIRCGVFFAKMLLNIVLMVFVAYNCKKWKIIKFIEIIVWIHAIETVVALLLPKSSLWTNLYASNGKQIVSRLRLFYMDAASMAFASGLVLVILVYQILTEEVIWRQIIGIGIMLIDLYLSVGLSGIGCALISIVIMLIMSYISKVREGKRLQAKAKKYGFGILSIFGLTAIFFTLNTIYMERIRSIIDGSDNVVYKKILEPLENIVNVLKATHFLGVGFGNANTRKALDVLNTTAAYPNSFLRIIAEGGIWGIILVLICTFGIGYYCFKYGTIIDKTLFIYIICYQSIGGYFTDSTNFFIYGWIIGECLYNKVKKEGSCKIKIFNPRKKEKLRIAMIGHKRIPSREGGVEIVVEELSKRMVKLGHDVDVYNRGGQHISGSEFNMVDYNRLHEYEGINIIRIPTVQRKLPVYFK